MNKNVIVLLSVPVIEDNNDKTFDRVDEVLSDAMEASKVYDGYHILTYDSHAVYAHDTHHVPENQLAREIAKVQSQLEKEPIKMTDFMDELNCKYNCALAKKREEQAEIFKAAVERIAQLAKDSAVGAASEGLSFTTIHFPIEYEFDVQRKLTEIGFKWRQKGTYNTKGASYELSGWASDNK